ncbi:hypothetical protein DFH09DRAFT_1336807 [Mycena vulgaris]|nr:hypothetical protein DFH09DRAFT_1336807 [Mycena vulgaris]
MRLIFAPTLSRLPSTQALRCTTHSLCFIHLVPSSPASPSRHHHPRSPSWSSALHFPLSFLSTSILLTQSTPYTRPLSPPSTLSHPLPTPPAPLRLSSASNFPLVGVGDYRDLPALPGVEGYTAAASFPSAPTLVAARVGVVVDDGDHGHAAMMDELLRPPLAGTSKSSNDHTSLTTGPGTDRDTDNAAAFARTPRWSCAPAVASGFGARSSSFKMGRTTTTA